MNMTPLAGWGNFYVILGSSAGALIGLQFIFITLIAEGPRAPDLDRAGAAFGTPTVVHFAMVLLLSALVAAPWNSVAPAAVAWGVAGLGGVVYIAIVARRMRQQRLYRPQLEDWFYYALLPFFAYALLAVAAFVSGSHLRAALFTVAGAAGLLLFIGIRNAWDTVTYHVFVSRSGTTKKNTEEKWPSESSKP